MKINKVHCLFEQSGTFKNQFKKLGYDAIDYDIQNEFGETDKIVDLFMEIRGGYEDKPSIFDEISKDDLIVAFFPCVRFEDQALLLFRCDQYQMKKKTEVEKLEIDLITHEELSELYEVITKLSIICLKRGLRIIIENPYSTQHYLTNYWCLKPSIVDKDRTRNGDYYKKPTQYWFLNCAPENNVIFEPLEYVELKTISNYKHKKNNNLYGKSRSTSRSMIHPQYVSRFIRQYVIDYQQDISELYK